MKKLLIIFLCCCMLVTMVSAQSPEVLAIRKYNEQNAGRIISEYVKFLSVPNIASDTVNLKKTAAFVMGMMEAKGIQHLQYLTPSTMGAPPAVYGEVNVPGATQTLIFYAHYDGQPVNPVQWAKGLAQFSPQLFTNALEKNGRNIPFPADGNTYDPDWRIYARSSSDDKAGVAAILNAYDALKTLAVQPASNLKFFFEGEEEAGSPHLYEILEKYAPLLQSDLWVICDGPVHQSGKKEVVFGARGDAHLDLTIYASKRPLHSGHYGNWAPNPAMLLAKLLASMKDDNGRVSIKGFYDDVKPLSPAEKKIVKELPPVDDLLKNELGFIAEEMPGISLGEAINLPSLNINGMQSGNVGKLASNQIPALATAVIDLRLVVGNDWRRQQQKVIDHIRSMGYYVCTNDPTDEERKKYSRIIKVIASNDGYNAQRTPIELPAAKKMVDAVQGAGKDPIVLLPTMGGSLPLYVFEKYLNAKTISVPIANHDNNQHAENENIRLQNFWEGIEIMGALMMAK